MFGTVRIGIRHAAVAIVGLLAVAAAASGALADTIYLKNGRTIHTAETRIEGDRVFFVQYGGEVSIPLSLVERVVEDRQAGPEARPTAPAGQEVPEEPAEDAEDAEAAEGGEVVAEEGAAAEAEEGEEVPERQTREYWQDRRRQITERVDALEEQLDELRREERAFLFAHHSTAHVRRQIEQAEAELQEEQERLGALREEARRAGVPPGWVRE